MSANQPPRIPLRDDLSGNYVECAECGDAIEDHSPRECAYCPCTEPWTQDEIGQVRIREGLNGEVTA